MQRLSALAGQRDERLDGRSFGERAPRRLLAREFRLERSGLPEQVIRHAGGPRRIVECFDVLLRAGDHVRESISITMLDVAAASWSPRHGALHVAADDLHLVDAHAGAHGVMERPCSPPCLEGLKIQ